MLSNFHTHTCWCDGKNTPRQVAQAALEKGFDVLGFSGHGYTPFDDSFCMSPQHTIQYRQEVGALRNELQGRLKIYLGCEEDLFAPVERSAYDFVISSLHYVKIGGVFYPVDESEETFRRIVRESFSGDYLAFAEEYYRTLERLLPQASGQIAGHLDLITKYNEGNKLFSESDPRYRRAALRALDSAEGKIIEVNTGAMARGLRSAPYPSAFLLEEIQRRGWPVILSSDCHDAAFLDYAFIETRKFLQKLGFSKKQLVEDPVKY